MFIIIINYYIWQKIYKYKPLGSYLKTIGCLILRESNDNLIIN